jgi:hypothetical protein
MDVPERYLINDSRSLKEFSEKSFSGYLKKDVLAIFQKSIVNYKVEDTCNWLVELIISGQIDKIWDKIFAISTKLININCPSLPNYLYTKYSLFNNICQQENYQKNILLLRNNQVIRNHLAEICVNLATMDKEKAINLTKISKNDLYFKNISGKLQAKDTRFINLIYQKNDPEEIKIIINEMINSLNISFKDTMFWLSWILEWEKLNIKKNKTYGCAFREITNVEQKYWNELIWLLWEVILKFCIKKDVDFLNLQVQSLYKLFKFNYAPSKKSKKIPFMIYAIRLITDNYNISTPIFKKYYISLQACCKINIIFLDKKSFEHMDQGMINIIKQKSLSSKVIRDPKEVLKEKEKEKEKEKDKKLKSKSKSKNKDTKISDESNKKFNILGKIDKKIINTGIEKANIIKKKRIRQEYREVRNEVLKNLPITKKESKSGEDFIKEIEDLLEN